MMDAGPAPSCRARGRAIGAVGTVARVVVGGFLVGSVLLGHVRHRFHPLPWVVGLLVFPGLLLGWQRLRLRYASSPVRATGPVAHVLTVAVFFALYLTPYYAPPLSLTSDAALLFYGASMLLAAARGYAGCEALAISNWLLRRDDELGCLLFLPVDRADRRRPTAAPQPGGPYHG